MKLQDLVNQLRLKGGEVGNLIRNPVQVIRYGVFKRARSVYENVEIPGQDDDRQNGRNKRAPREPQKNLRQPETTTSPTSRAFASETQETRSNLNYFPVSGDNSFSYGPTSGTSAVLAGDRRNRQSRSLLPLELNEQIRGAWGTRYHLRRVLKRSNWLCLYEGYQEYNQESVWIYVYVLPHQTLTKQEIDYRKSSFDKLVNANLKLGHDRDFRIVKIEDVFVDSRRPYCYLVTKVVPEAYPLSDYLESENSLENKDLQIATEQVEKSKYLKEQVKEILRQTLQSLKYLHRAYRVYWGNDSSEQGLCHGNLNLDNLLLKLTDYDTLTGAPQFFVYLSGFALWEHIFSSPTSNIAASSQDLGDVQSDLKDLGWVAFGLLIGQKINPQDNPQDQFDPTDNQYWSQSPHIIGFKPYILRLLGKGSNPAFKTIEEAEIALRDLDFNVTEQPRDNSTSIDYFEEVGVAPSSPQPKRRKKKSLLFLLALAGLGGLFFVLLRLVGSNSSTPSLIPASRGFCEVNQCEIDGSQGLLPFPNQPISYAIETRSSWNHIFNKSFGANSTDNLERILEKNVESLISLERQFLWELSLAESDEDSLLLDEELSNFSLETERELQASFAPESENLTKEILFQNIRSGKLDFGLIQLLDQESEFISEEFEFEVVGFDAIAMLVAFSDANREGSLPKRLDGEISLNLVREIFTEGQSQGTQWQYQPWVMVTEEAGDSAQDFTQQIDEIEPVLDDFRQLAFTSDEERKEFLAFVQDDEHQVANIYDHLLRSFEAQEVTDPTVDISFDRFSNMFAQCSVYPLAIRQGVRTSSLIVEANGSVITPYTDLCDKGRYWANSEAFPLVERNGKSRLNRQQAYPLVMELAVVYPKCTDTRDDACHAGKAFAQRLNTLEGQYLLQELNIIPIVPIEQIRQNL